ncbi:MAG TPA: glycosyltransferase [Solirubrobacterales bacterium]
MNAPAQGQRPKVVLLGMMTKMPVAGVVWQNLHYLLGFERLGYEAYYVEAHGRTPSMLMGSGDTDASGRAAAFVASIMRRFGLSDRWAFRALHEDGRCFGMTEQRLQRLLGSAELIVNLHGGTKPLPELSATDRLVYLETDPVQLQLELAEGHQESYAFLGAHAAFFTFAENYRQEDCLLPVSDRFRFETTRQPVLPDLWETARPPAHERFTTIGNWSQPWRDVSMNGSVYTWSKDQEFKKLLDLPARVGRRFELALSSYEDADRELLEGHGWRVTPAMGFSTDLVAYRDFIAASAGEFTVAKDQNVRFRTGWFSDRSATYLASGRPVITQDTGFGCALPTGEGLFAFSDTEEVVEAVERIDREPERHRQAARDLAVEYFAPEVVLGEMLTHLGMRIPGRRGEVPRGPFPYGMSLTPVSRRPTRLSEETLAAVEATPPPVAVTEAPRPLASIVVVSFNSRVLTRLCLETVLTNTAETPFELIAVDNASADGSREYLEKLAGRDARVRVLANEENAGFPAACNQGLAAARGELLVLLNSDTMVSPGWLPRLRSHLDGKADLVGPVTNRIGNEAEVPVAYETYGDFLREAGARATKRQDEAIEIPMLTMFCLAMKRGTWERIGPLDESFGVGTLEDDDYSMRARRAGLRLLCAEDVLVHHFGEGSFGKLFEGGKHSHLLARNRRRFEEKWGEAWQPYRRRESPEYTELLANLRETLHRAVPSGSTVLVVSKGDERLLDLDELRAWHFPRLPDGSWPGHHPADSAEVIAGLEELHAQGAEYIVFPAPMLWWLDFYEELAQRLHGHAVHSDDTCSIYSLTVSPQRA